MQESRSNFRYMVMLFGLARKVFGGGERNGKAAKRQHRIERTTTHRTELLLPSRCGRRTDWPGVFLLVL